MNLDFCYDQHLHSRHSFDCQTPPEDNVRAAIDRGLAGLIFTEHFDPHPEEWRECVYDHRAYTGTIRRLREEFGERIFIGQGVEVGYYRERLDFTLDFLAAGDFDCVILSLHAIDHRLLHLRESWENLSVPEGSRRYFEHLLEAVEFARDVNRRGSPVFNILGHLDLVKRYTRRFFADESVDANADLIDRILRACLDAGMIPEINTSTWRQGLDEPMPGPAVLRRYAELGGRAISLGSDAHRAEDIGAGFADAILLARASGLSQVACFRNTLPQRIPLNHD
ncbi:MAG: Histidinol-phosphatase [Phycisphaerae bacterium]|nr:Histidinol-phosphatase [Phycisphaerae bacterium]